MSSPFEIQQSHKYQTKAVYIFFVLFETGPTETQPLETKCFTDVEARSREFQILDIDPKPECFHSQLQYIVSSSYPSAELNHTFQ